MREYSISVIVLVYNNAPYIERCVNSLMLQSLKDIEYIIIDDGSDDGSMDIAMSVVERYSHRKRDVKTITHAHNMGIAYTRQEGIDMATGEYVIHCDTDDWTHCDYYQALYQAAKVADADMAIGNYKYECKDVSVVNEVGAYATWKDFTKSEFEQLALWNRLVRRRMLIENNIRIYEGVNFSEDYGLIFQCYYYSKKNVKITQDTYYHYNRVNPNQTTHNINELPKLNQKVKCLKRLTQFVIDKGEDPNSIRTLNQEKRAVKEGYLLTSPPAIEQWQDTFPEVTRDIIKDPNLSYTFKLSWALGQYVSSWFMKYYLKLSLLKQNV